MKLDPLWASVRHAIPINHFFCIVLQFRSIIFSALFIVAPALTAIAQSEPAALVDFNNGDRRSAGTVAWRTEQVKTSDGREDLTIRADVDLPSSNLKLTMLLRRNLDPAVPASHLIDLAFIVPPRFHRWQWFGLCWQSANDAERNVGQGGCAVGEVAQNADRWAVRGRVVGQAGRYLL
jgi:hypothetical protein